jgi:hypothetical protein
MSREVNPFPFSGLSDSEIEAFRIRTGRDIAVSNERSLYYSVFSSFIGFEDLPSWPFCTCSICVSVI